MDSKITESQTDGASDGIGTSESGQTPREPRPGASRGKRPEARQLTRQAIVGEARPTRPAHSDLADLDGQQTLVTFRLSRQTYALPIEPIERVVEMVAITPIPHVDRSIAGVINYHGVPVPAIDLRRLLDIPAVPWGLDTHIVVAEIDERKVGLIVDEVLDVLELASVRVVRPEDFLPDGVGEIDLLGGLAQMPGAVVFVLDPGRLFSPRRAEALAQAIAYVTEDTVTEPEVAKEPDQENEA